MAEDWILDLQDGDPAAFEELVRRLSPAIYRLAFSMMGNEHDAKDAVQETFIKVFQALPHFRGESAVATWVTRIAANTCKDMLRAQGRYQLVSADDEELFFEIPDGTPSPEEAAITKEQKEMVRLAVNSLPTEHKLVITLCDLQGFSYMEAAQILDCPLGTLKSRLYRARACLLKKFLQNRELFADGKRQTFSKEDRG